MSDGDLLRSIKGDTLPNLDNTKGISSFRECHPYPWRRKVFHTVSWKPPISISGSLLEMWPIIFFIDPHLQQGVNHGKCSVMSSLFSNSLTLLYNILVGFTFEMWYILEQLLDFKSISPLLRISSKCNLFIRANVLRWLKDFNIMQLNDVMMTSLTLLLLTGEFIKFLQL